MADSFGKRENEKKKQAKRLEKQKRKDERKKDGGGSLDDMIAYVDANGNIVDTPPDQVVEEVDLESIAISVPKREHEEAEPFRGRVEYFNASKGYGFIRESEGGEKFFFHVSNAPQDIAEGNKVLFETERGTRGMNAVSIRIDR